MEKIALPTSFNQYWNDAYALLYAVFHYTTLHEIPAPAAFLGEWHSYKAIIVPSITFEENSSIEAGWIGYYSYPDRLTEARLPVIMGGKPAGVLGQDHNNQWWWLEFQERPSYRDEAALSYPLWILQLQYESLPDSCSINWETPAEQYHKNMVDQAQAAIRRGDVYQVNLCTAFTGITDADTIDIFCSIGSHLQAHKSAFLTGSWGTIASFSPETFLSTQDRHIQMNPIKGTLPIEDNPTILANSHKDRAENIMIVDVVRNDMSKIIELFSMEIPRLCEVIPAPGVWHLVSTITGTLQNHISPQNIIDATFPIASITGAPKMSACQLIAAWEERARGVYCGFAGIVLNNGDMDLSVLIRTLEITPQKNILLGVGGGITIDSTPENEFHELCAKAEAIMQFSHKDI